MKCTYDDMINSFYLNLGYPSAEDEYDDKDYKVYFIFDGTHVKIGIAKKPLDRLHMLRTGNPNNLQILFLMHCVDKEDALKLESFLHLLFSKFKVSREWFDIYDILVEETIGYSYDCVSREYLDAMEDVFERRSNKHGKR